MTRFEIKPKFIDFDEIKGAMGLGYFNHAWKCLQDFYALLKHSVTSPDITYYTGRLRRITFVPYGGPNSWNRKTELMFREMEKIQAEHLHQTLHEALDNEWELSGLKREEYLHGNVEFTCSRCGR